jgi:hypothetical protein
LTEFFFSISIDAIVKRRLQHLRTFHSVVKALGGTGDVARLTEQTPSAVCNWFRYRGLFPTKYFFTMQEALAERGFTAPRWLWGFHGTIEGEREAA